MKTVLIAAFFSAAAGFAQAAPVTSILGRAPTHLTAQTGLRLGDGHAGIEAKGRTGGKRASGLARRGGGGNGGCGSRGGPGYRKANGKCASHKD